MSKTMSTAKSHDVNWPQIGTLRSRLAYNWSQTMRPLPLVYVLPLNISRTGRKAVTRSRGSIGLESGD
jgi:hypothetical protein